MPITVFCIPAVALNVEPTVAELLTVSAFTVALPVALKVDTMAVLPPADPNVPFNGPFTVSLAVIVAPVKAALALPIVAAFIVVPVKVPATLNVVPMVAELLIVRAFTVALPLVL